MFNNKFAKTIFALILLSLPFGYLRSGYNLGIADYYQKADCLSETFIDDLALSPDGKELLAITTKIHAVWLWDTENGKELWNYRNEEADSSEITSIAFSPNGKYFLISDLDRAIVWDSFTFAQVGIFPRPKRTSRFTEAVFLPDSEHILVSGASDGVQLWEIASQKLVRSFPGVTRAILSPDGNYILVGSNYDSWDLWDIKKGIRLHNFPVILTPSFTPDSKWIATENEKNGVMISSLQKSENARSILPPRDYPSGWMFSPDSKYLLTSGGDSSTKILVEVSTGKIVYTFTNLAPIFFYFRDNSFLEFEMYSTPKMVTKVKIWMLNDFSLMTDTVIDTGKTNFLKTSLDGKYLLTNSDTKGYLLWNMDTLQIISRFC